MPKFIEVTEIYKAAYLISRLNVLPELKDDSQAVGNFIFIFPDTSEVRSTINDYLTNTELKKFVETYKYLRSIIYQRKRG